MTLTVGGNRITYYFRHRFNGLSGITTAPLRIRHPVDDGVAIYLNGQPLHARGVTPPLDYLSVAGRTVDNAVFEGPFDLPESALLASAPSTPWRLLCRARFEKRRPAAFTKIQLPVER